MGLVVNGVAGGILNPGSEKFLVGEEVPGTVSPGSCRFFIYFRPAKIAKFYGANPVSSSHPYLE